MRDYAKLAPFFWVRGSGRRLRGDVIAQLVAAYLSTCPASNMVGVFYVSIATIAEDVGLSAEDARAALERVETARYAFYDFEAGIVWIPNHARFEIGAEMSTGDKRRKRVLAELAQVEGHRFEAEFRSMYGAAYGLKPSTSTPPPPPSTPKPDVTLSPNGRHPKGHPATADGASADREQDRAGQIRTDQDRTGARGIVPARRFAPGTSAAAEARDRFAAAVTTATGKPFTLNRAPFHTSDLCDLLNAHAPPGSAREALGWLEPTVGEWVTSLGGKSASGWQPSRLLDWLNGGRASPSSRTRPRDLVQPSDHREWEVPEGMR